MEHIGNCVCHFAVPRWLIRTLRTQIAQEEEVGAGEGGFRKGISGEHEWEATSGAIKWWPRWGENGEASLFANFYLTFDSDVVQVCVDPYQPHGDYNENCPWYEMQEEERVITAGRAFWLLAARALMNKLNSILNSQGLRRHLELNEAYIYADMLHIALKRVAHHVPFSQDVPSIER